MRTASSNRCRTRSGSAPTSSPARISSSSPSRCDDGAVVFRVFVKPLVNLIWLAGIVFVLGSLIALWPDPREERRLATRYTRGGALRDARDDVSGWLLLAAALAVAVVVVVALPFLREPAPVSDALHELDSRERELLEAEEERDRALAALKELEADHRAGRLSDQDYRGVVGPLRQEAAQALRTLDRLAAGTRGRGERRLMGRRAGLVSAALPL